MPTSKKIDTDYIVETAKNAGAEVSKEIAEVHGPIWEGQENLAKLIISLSSAMLVGTITFSANLVGDEGSRTNCPQLLIGSWILLFLTICLAGMSLWFAVTLKSFRARLTNAEPFLHSGAQTIDPDLSPEQITDKCIELVKEYAGAATKPLGRADNGARYSLNASLVFFCLGLAVFLWFGALQIT